MERFFQASKRQVPPFSVDSHPSVQNRSTLQLIYHLSNKVLRFTTIPSLLIVLGMFLMIGGMLLWAGTILFFLPSVFPQILAGLPLPYNSWLLQFIGMLIALVVMLRALFSRSHARAEARPKDVSPSDMAASRELGYYPVDGNNE
jgi:hypothetical protein